MRRTVVLVALVTVALAAPVDALTQGTEILVPAGFRGAGTAGSQWITTLYIQNPGTTTASWPSTSSNVCGLQLRARTW